MSQRLGAKIALFFLFAKFASPFMKGRDELMLAFVVICGLGLIKILCDDARDRDLEREFNETIEICSRAAQRRLNER